MPTTLALIPINAACIRTFLLSDSQKGSAPATNKNEGKNMANKQINAPIQPVRFPVMDAPKKAANVNNGPGIAWVKP